MGRLTPEVFFRASLFAAQETEGERDQGDVMVPAEPAAAFKVVKSELLFEFAVILFDLPASAGGVNSRAQGSKGRA
jgi:hypothetical protein